MIQKRLFSGLDCLPGQQDLFPADGPADKAPMPPDLDRITTATQLLAHMRLNFPRDLFKTKTRKEIARSVAYNSNTEHDPATGFLRFKPDTPDWVRLIPGRRPPV